MYIRRWLAVLAFCAVAWPAGQAFAGGVTTGAISGIVTDAQGQPVEGAEIIAIHEPSGTSYEAVTRGDGRFSLPAMRVGGPYSVTVAFTGGGGTAFAPETQADVTVNLGVSTDLNITVNPIAVTEEVTVSAQVDPVFSSSRTGGMAVVNNELVTRSYQKSAFVSDVYQVMLSLRYAFN